MRTLLISFFTVLISFTMVVPEAEAKRFGGGSSFGKSFTSPKKVSPAPTQKQAAPTGTQGTQATQPRRSGFGGLMGGLLAGGLLGALFFGGAFDGIQMMDIILIGLLIFIAIKLFSGMKSAKGPEYAGHQQGYNQPQQRQQVPEEQVFDHSAPGAGASAGFAFGDSALELPAWFNESAFVEGAKGHFTNLQQAWDRSDWQEIGSYTTPELLQVLQQERAKHPADQHTEVVSVMAELINFIDNNDHVIASVNFYGWLKENEDNTTEFNETWHLMRDMSVDNADWKIVGIQQL